MVKASLTRQQARDALAHRYLRHFWRQYWSLVPPSVEPVWGWHYDYVADRVQATLERGYGTLVVALPAGTGKSTALSVLTPIWDWVHRPWANWLAVSKGNTKSAASRDSHRMRTVLEDPVMQAFLARCPHVGGVPVVEATKPRDDHNQKADFLNAAGGRRYSFGLRSESITGNDAHRLLVDDPIDGNDVIGEPEVVARRLKRASAVYNGTLTDRLRMRPEWPNNKPPGPRIIIAQRTHKYDLVGEFIRRRDAGEPDIEVIVVPEEYNPKVAGGACPADPRTKPGEMLNPAFRNEEWIEAERMAEGGKRKVAIRYNHRELDPEGGPLPREVMVKHVHSKDVDTIATQGRIAAAVDCSTGKKTPGAKSNTVITVCVALGSHKHVIHERAGKWEVGERARQIAAVQRMFAKLRHWHVEDEHNGEATRQLLTGRDAAGRPFFPTWDGVWHKVKAGAKKDERAEIFIEEAQQGRWHEADPVLYPWSDDALDEIAGWRAGGTNDDRIDTRAILCDVLSVAKRPNSAGLAKALARRGW